MDDMLGLLFFPRMNWMACKQYFFDIFKWTVHGREEIMNVCNGYGTRCIQNQIEKSKENENGYGSGDGGDNFTDPCQEFKQGFWGVSSGLPLV
jgi:hypothetical protein